MDYSQEQPAATMLRVEAQNEAKMGEATPTPVTGQLQNNPNLPAGYMTDATNKIFRAPSTTAPASVAPASPGSVAPAATPTATSNPGSTGTGSNGSTGSNNPSGKTMADLYYGLIPSGNPELDSALAAQKLQIKNDSNPVDEASIRDRVMQGFQSQIDSLNQAYAEQKRAALEAFKPTEQNRLGSNIAQQARGGLLGSDFGSAQTDRVNTRNAQDEQDIAAKIDAERVAALKDIYNKADALAADEINKKQDAYRQGPAALVTFLQGQETRKNQNVSDTINNIINSGATPNDDMYKYLADTLGVSTDTLKSKYGVAKKAADELAAKNAKANYETVAPGSTIVDPATGKVVYTAPEKASANKDWVHVPATKYQREGYFNQSTGEFKPGTAGKPDTSNTTGGSTSADQILASRGSDGFVNTQVYSDAYDQAVKAGPKAVKNFIAQFPPETFLNPQDKTAHKFLNTPSQAANTKTGTFLNQDFFRKSFSDSQLLQSAKDAGYGGPFKSAEKTTQDYLNHLDSLIQQYRDAGYSDEAILKMMQ